MITANLFLGIITVLISVIVYQAVLIIFKEIRYAKMQTELLDRLMAKDLKDLRTPKEPVMVKTKSLSDRKEYVQSQRKQGLSVEDEES